MCPFVRQSFSVVLVNVVHFLNKSGKTTQPCETVKHCLPMKQFQNAGQINYVHQHILLCRMHLINGKVRAETAHTGQQY